MIGNSGLLNMIGQSTALAREPRLKLYTSPLSSKERKAQFLETLYNDHWDELCGWLYKRYGAGPPEPEDIAQTAFEKIAALESIESLTKQKSNARAFLFTTAVNTALMAFRRLAVQRRYIDYELKKHDKKVEEISPERIYSSKQYFERVVCTMDTLSDKQRELIVRNRIQGQTYAEIKAETGWSPADISRQLNTALAIIETNLYGQDDKKAAGE